MKQVFIARDGVRIDEVPAPLARDGEILVRVLHSCISVGTEVSGVRSVGTPLWKRVLQEPEKLTAVFAAARKEGLMRTRRLVRTKLDALFPVGYSAAGRVIGVGAGAEGFRIGDLVACGGSQWAYHAEIVAVPQNLAIALPDALATREASTVSLGAIALQAVRRAAPTLGETFVVVGLGLLGQITQQLLRANGVRVIGIDTDAERVAKACSLGMSVGWSPADENSTTQVSRITGTGGADGVIVTASSASHEVISDAFRMCRRKARVVLVGDVGLNLRRGDIYEKELDFLVSTSYGPGRYDAAYEERGVDYPLPYVRWTEKRNMEEYLRLIAEGKVVLSSLIDSDVALDDAPEAYKSLTSGTGRKPLAVVLNYIDDESAPKRRIELMSSPVRSGKISLGMIGTGGFAQTTLLPIIASMKDQFELRGVVSRQGHNAMTIGRQYGAAYATTERAELLTDPIIDAVLIATRHSDHADQVLATLAAGKSAFVEKPLCLSRSELNEIRRAVADKGDASPLVLTGFNRRFSPYAQEIRRLTKDRSGPLMMQYTVNAGYIAGTHWVHGPEGGGRNLGEACHFYDLFTYFTGSRVVEVTAQSIVPKGGYYRSDDNFTASIRFQDGSVATLLYSAMGHSAISKERLEIIWDGKIAQLDDFRELRVHGVSHSGIKTAFAEKGHVEEFKALHECLAKGGEWPIPFWQQLQASEIALDVDAMLSEGVSHSEE
jgi:predicted dehydrogenase/threonine dehydrogenase-like Zn-dependent dehydrogenase